jgi:DNA-binding transcriptional ArsR family regulator
MATIKTSATTTSSPGKLDADRARKDADRRLRQAQRAAVLLKYVSDPTRLQVILLLDQAETHTGGLSEALNQPQPAVSHHLALLRHGEIVVARRAGKNTIYALTATGSLLARVVKGLVA